MPVAPLGAAAPVVPVAAAPPKPAFGALLETRAAPASPPCAPPRPSPALATLARVERAQARLDAVLQAARSGRTFTAQELLGLQAEVYRTAQTVDLAAKLVEQGAQAVKQTINTQL